MSKFEYAEAAARFIRDEIRDYFGRQMGSIQNRDGGLFISVMADGKMMSAYWHPDRTHSATCLHGDKVVQRAVSDPGYWAIAWASCSSFGGNKCKYNDEAEY